MLETMTVSFLKKLSAPGLEINPEEGKPNFN